LDLTQITDSEGFLLDLNDWTPEIAQAVADTVNIQLSEEHWLVINATRAFYLEFDQSPSMRLLVKWLKNNDLTHLATSIKLMSLFGESPARQASLISGLPKPDNCL